MNRPTADRPRVCVVGGAGHVGAPLAIVLAGRGISTTAYDTDAGRLAMLSRGEMPFVEEGGTDALRAAIGSGCLRFAAHPSTVGSSDVVIITIGTPIDEFQSPRIDDVRRCVDEIFPYLTGQTIVLRSTVAPGVTDHLARYLEGRGRPLGVAFCPERVVQGKAITEIATIPQIVSGSTSEAEEVAAALFASIAPVVIRMRPIEAEFAKLISNAWRYIEFAAANQFYMLVESAGVDYPTVLAGLKKDYPRMTGLPGPGFAAGPCLMKDAVQLAAFDPSAFPLGRAAISVNEGLPDFLVSRLAARRDLAATRVGILGMAFKADIDDTRQSLSYRLAKLLRFRGAEVRCSDEYARDPAFVSIDEVLRSSDVIIVGVPHQAYGAIEVPQHVELLDLWGIVRGHGERVRTAAS